MALPIIYRSGKEQLLKTGSITDIFTGRIYATLYAGEVVDENNSTDHVLSFIQFDSADIAESVTPSSTSYTKEVDQDYDITVEDSFTIDGVALCEITVSARSATGSNQGSAYAIVKLRHFDGTTETELDSFQTENITPASQPLTDSRRYTGVLNCARTTFKRGDTLRLTVELWGKYITGSSDVNVAFGQDPNNRAAESVAVIESGESTSLKLHLPLIPVL